MDQTGRFEDLMFITDLFLKEAQSKQPPEDPPMTFVMCEEDKYGFPLPKRKRRGQRRRPASSRANTETPTVAPTSTMNPSCMPSTSGQLSFTETFQDKDGRELLRPADDPTPSHWTARKASSSEKWTALRPLMVNQLLTSEKPKGGHCHHCLSQAAAIMCRDCLPKPLHCPSCDLTVHDRLVLHNRSAMVEGFYRPLPPTTFVKEEGGNFTYHEKVCFLPVILPCCDCSTGQYEVSAGKQIILIGMNGRYNLSLPTATCSCGKSWDVGLGDLVQNGYWPDTDHFETLYTMDLVASYEDLKVTAPGMSWCSFVGMLQQRTKLFGRSGRICGNTMKKAFLEWSNWKGEVQRLSQMNDFHPACTPSMSAVEGDGNHQSGPAIHPSPAIQPSASSECSGGLEDQLYPVKQV